MLWEPFVVSFLRVQAPSFAAILVRRPHQAGAATAWHREPARLGGGAMGLDKRLASSRVNRYENQTRGIDLDGLGKLAETLGVPMAYLVAEDEYIADAILALSQLSPEERKAAAELFGKLAKKQEP